MARSAIGGLANRFDYLLVTSHYLLAKTPGVHFSQGAGIA